MQEYPPSSSAALVHFQLLDHQVHVQPIVKDDGDDDDVNESDLHGEHKGGESVVASDVEAGGWVGQ